MYHTNQSSCWMKFKHQGFCGGKGKTHSSNCAQNVHQYGAKSKSRKLSFADFLRWNNICHQCCGSGCLSQIRLFSIPDPGSTSKLSILSTKIVFLSSRKYDPGSLSLIRILILYPPESRGQKGIGSRIRNTVCHSSPNFRGGTFFGHLS